MINQKFYTKLISNCSYINRVTSRHFEGISHLRKLDVLAT